MTSGSSVSSSPDWSSASSSSSSPFVHTVTLSSKSTADRCVINIPVADCHDPVLLFSPPSNDWSFQQPPPFLPTLSLSSFSLEQAAPAPDPASPAPPNPPPSRSVPPPTALSRRAAPPSSEPAPVLTSEQRRLRRKVRHRDIDANRREKEATALAELEKAMDGADHPRHANGGSETVNGKLLLESGSVDELSPSGCVGRPRKRTKSKAAVISTAASRITHLEQRLAVATQQLERRQMDQTLSLAYASFFHTSPTQAVVFSPSERRIVDANDAFCRFAGYSHRELQQSRIAFCPAPSKQNPNGRRLEQRAREAAEQAEVEQWEVDANGNTVLVPVEQQQHNLDRLEMLMVGSRRKVVCIFRIALAGQQLTESQCDCWLTGGPVTTPEDCDTTARFIVVQTSADRYRPLTQPQLRFSSTSRPVR